MNQQFTQKLYKDFPLLYSDKNKPLSMSLMGFGFECGDGWFQIIYDLSKCLTEMIAHQPKFEIRSDFRWNPKHWTWFKPWNSGWRHYLPIKWFLFPECWSFYIGPLLIDIAFPRKSFRVVQVKEKYGTLRFYMTYETEEMSEAIEEAEQKSAKTCEACGSVGTMNDGPWFYVACAECKLRGFKEEHI